jgi:hypothetical protein
VLGKTTPADSPARLSKQTLWEGSSSFLKKRTKKLLTVARNA